MKLSRLSGVQRIGVVLSGFFWAFAAFCTWAQWIAQGNEADRLPAASLVVLGFAITYAVLAAIWFSVGWIIAGFRRTPLH